MTILKIFMCTKEKYYHNKTKIPDFLKPLPMINKTYAMKYRVPNFEPMTLAAISCQTLMLIEINFNNYRSWNDFVETFQNNSRIVPDSYRRFCSINGPFSSTAFILNKAKEKTMKLDQYLKLVKVLDDSKNQRNHWEMSNSPKRFPFILVGNIKK